jgi:hypothetical protein
MRDATAVGLTEEIVGYQSNLPAPYEPTRTTWFGLEPGGWKEVREIVLGIVVVLSMWIGIPWLLIAVATR